MLITVSLVLAFALLLALFGITGREAKAVEDHIDTELAIIAAKINDDFSRASLGGITIAESFSEQADGFFGERGITSEQLDDHPELILPLLAEYMPELISAAESRYCGGAFVLLDASITDDGEAAKAGIFIKKTQPTATDEMGVQLYCLRGPANIARENGIMLLGQWRMEYDISEQDYFTEVMDTARENPQLPLSRLYYWAGRVILKGNSEAGFLLCVPLRTADGTVFGLCGVEVSDRLFKSLYTPEGGDFENIFTVMAPCCENGLCTSSGLVAGNSYLTGNRWDYDFTESGSHDTFHHYVGGGEEYGGKTVLLNLYPGGSPYEEQEWSVSVLMPKDILHAAVKGNASYFSYTIIGLLLVAVVASVLISRYYLRPVNKAFDRIKNGAYTGNSGEVYSEINDLFDYLAEKDREYDLALQQKQQEVAAIQNEHEKAKIEISRLAYSRKTEIDPDNYRLFLENLHTLTLTERIVFDHYLDGKSAKDIMAIMDIKEPTLKYHNRNIYSKLGISSRKELLRYAALMRQEESGQE
ncbi:MAG: hypothetical protein IJC70_07520 [Firmicutes bacterium]|nr:hypothetical protein [Bacillota bacterium]